MSATAADDARRYPFLFLGQGFGMCRKCLEGYFWFERSPTVEEQALITAAVPLPVQNVSRFDGALMHWGSDDMLPERVNAVYNPAFAGMSLDDAYRHACDNAQPDAATLALVSGAEQSSLIGQLLAHTAVASEREWAAFCTAFEQATHAIHAICPLRVVLKPDDKRGRVLGPWHHWSASRASDVIAVQPPSPVTRSWSYFAANLSADVLGAEQIAELPPAARRSWITWLAAIISDAPRELVTTLVSTFDKLVVSFAESDRVQIIREVSDDARRAVDAEHERRAVKDLLNKGSAAEIAQAIDSGQLAIERAITTLAANRRREPGLNDVVENSRILSLIRRAHTADIGAAVAAGQITQRDLRRCAKAWEDVAEPLLRVAVLAAPLDDADLNSGSIHSKRTSPRSCTRIRCRDIGRIRGSRTFPILRCSLAPNPSKLSACERPSIRRSRSAGHTRFR